MMRRILFLAAVLAGACNLFGCTHVQPWEKSTLAKDTMKPSGTIPETKVFDGHVYYSKEAIQGGTGVGGGGCGCN